MNYHNFASRLSAQRLPAASSKDVTKPAPKKPRRPSPRRLAVAVPILVLFCLLAPGTATFAESDAVRASVVAPQHADAASYIIPLIGLAVVLLRLPILWRRDFQC